MSCFVAVLFPTLKQCWGKFYLITLPKSSQFWNIADVYTVLLQLWEVPVFGNIAFVYRVLLHCWSVLHPKTLLRHTLFYYTAEMFSIFEHCWRMPSLVNCWVLPNNKNLLMYTLSFYNSEKFPILKQWWRITCLVKMLSCSQFWNFANLNLIFLLCWVVPIFESLLT